MDVLTQQQRDALYGTYHACNRPGDRSLFRVVNFTKRNIILYIVQKESVLVARTDLDLVDSPVVARWVQDGSHPVGKLFVSGTGTLDQVVVPPDGRYVFPGAELPGDDASDEVIADIQEKHVPADLRVDVRMPVRKRWRRCPEAPRAPMPMAHGALTNPVPLTLDSDDDNDTDDERPALVAITEETYDQ